MSALIRGTSISWMVWIWQRSRPITTASKFALTLLVVCDSPMLVANGRLTHGGLTVIRYARVLVAHTTSSNRSIWAQLLRRPKLVKPEIGGPAYMRYRLAWRVSLVFGGISEQAASQAMAAAGAIHRAAFGPGKPLSIPPPC